jgi:DNA-binding HxlR family transcriptional regulator
MEPPSHRSRPLGLLERTCPVRTAIGVIAGKWKPSILRGIH